MLSEDLGRSQSLTGLFVTLGAADAFSFRCPCLGDARVYRMLFAPCYFSDLRDCHVTAAKRRFRSVCIYRYIINKSTISKSVCICRSDLREYRSATEAHDNLSLYNTTQVLPLYFSCMEPVMFSEFTMYALHA